MGIRDPGSGIRDLGSVEQHAPLTLSLHSGLNSVFRGPVGRGNAPSGEDHRDEGRSSRTDRSDPRSTTADLGPRHAPPALAACRSHPSPSPRYALAQGHRVPGWERECRERRIVAPAPLRTPICVRFTHTSRPSLRGGATSASLRLAQGEGSARPPRGRPSPGHASLAREGCSLRRARRRQSVALPTPPRTCGGWRGLPTRA